MTDCCAPAGENRTALIAEALPKRQHRREPSSLRRQRWVPDSVDAAVHTMKARGYHAPVDGPFVEPNAMQLRN